MLEWMKRKREISSVAKSHLKGWMNRLELLDKGKWQYHSVFVYDRPA